MPLVEPTVTFPKRLLADPRIAGFRWHPVGQPRPTPAEAQDRLDPFDAKGDTEYAFGWSHVPHTTLWQTQRCG